MKKITAILLACFVLFGIGIWYFNNAEVNSLTHLEDVGNHPDYGYTEWEKTRNPTTNKLNTSAFNAYLLQQKNYLGALGSDIDARIFPNGWMAVDDFFASLAVQGLTYNPQNSLEMYFCTGEGWNNAEAAQGMGIFKSSNGGITWEHLAATSSDTFSYCHDMLVHPVTQDVYVATRVGGIMRSSNAGTTWMQVLGQNNGSVYNNATGLELTADNELFALMGGTANTGQARTSDGVYFSESGNSGSWEKRMNGIPSTSWRIELSTAMSNANVAYAVPMSSIAADSGKISGIFKTIDKGQTWTAVSDPGGDKNLAKSQAWYDLVIKVDPNNENVVLTGGLNVYRTRDGGQTWQQMFEGDHRKKTDLQYVHVDQHEIVFKTSDTVLLGNDGGIYRCDNMRAEMPFFTSMNANYNVTQFYSCDISNKANTDFVIGGTQDNGSQGSTSEGISDFRQLSWADGSYCNINFKDPEIYYTTTQYARMYRHNHGNIDTITNGELKNSNTEFINAMEMDPNNPEIIYQLSANGLWRLENASTAPKENWEQVCRPFGRFTAIGISKNEANTVYIGRNSGGRIYRINNALNTDGTLIPFNCDKGSQLPSNSYANCIYVDPKDVNHVLVVYTNYGVESVWESFNANTDVVTWRSCEGNLPDIPIRWAMLHPTTAGVCYLATEAGVMVTQKLDGDSTIWTPTNEGLANLKVNMIKMRTVDNEVVAATHGRGIYTGKLLPDNSIIWTERGPSNVGGRTRTLMFDPNDPTGQKLWAGSVSGGLWVTQKFQNVDSFYDEVFDNTAKIGPIPSSLKSTKLFINSATPATLEVTMYATNGQKVLELSKGIKKGESEIKLDLQPYLVGRYYIRVKFSDYDKVFSVLVVE